MWYQNPPHIDSGSQHRHFALNVVTLISFSLLGYFKHGLLSNKVYNIFLKSSSSPGELLRSNQKSWSQKQNKNLFCHKNSSTAWKPRRTRNPSFFTSFSIGSSASSYTVLLLLLWRLLVSIMPFSWQIAVELRQWRRMGYIVRDFSWNLLSSNSK